MMVKLCQNLACLSHSANPLYIQLHAKIQQAQWYYIKHTYSNTHPWYGEARTRMGDACLQWIVQSDNLIST